MYDINDKLLDELSVYINNLACMGVKGGESDFQN